MPFLTYGGKPGTSASGYGGASRLEDLTIRGPHAASTVGVRMSIGGEADGVTVSDFGWHAWLIDADARRTTTAACGVLPA